MLGNEPDKKLAFLITLPTLRRMQLATSKNRCVERKGNAWGIRGITHARPEKGESINVRKGAEGHKTIRT